MGYLCNVCVGTFNLKRAENSQGDNNHKLKENSQVGQIKGSIGEEAKHMHPKCHNTHTELHTQLHTQHTETGNP